MSGGDEVAKFMDAQALDDIHSLCEFAYEQGYHEMGYDPVLVVRDVMQEALTELETMERCMIGIAPEAVSKSLPKLRALLSALSKPGAL